MNIRALVYPNKTIEEIKNEMEDEEEELEIKIINQKLKKIGGPICCIKVENLKPGLPYQFRVSAENSLGLADFSIPSLTTMTAADSIYIYIYIITYLNK